MQNALSRCRFWTCSPLPISPLVIRLQIRPCWHGISAVGHKLAYPWQDLSLYGWQDHKEHCSQYRTPADTPHGCWACSPLLSLQAMSASQSLDLHTLTLQCM